MGSSQTLYAAFLQGKLWVLRCSLQNIANAYSYSPTTNTWSTLATQFTENGLLDCSPFHELTDAVIRVWCAQTPGAGVYVARDYNVLTNTLSAGPNSSWNTNQGGNFAVTRTFNPVFSWFLGDGVSPAAGTERIGSLVAGDTVLYHLVCQTPVARAAGATLSIPLLLGTDAEDPVLVGPSSSGPWTTSFSTGALGAGQKFDVWVKVSPTVAQSFRMNKTFNVKVVAN